MEQINLLAADTSTAYLKIGLTINGREKLIDHDEGLNHLENLIPLIDDSFKELNASQKELQYAAVCCGPGSFTGIRIGLATIQGIAFAGGLNLFGFSAFDIYKFLLHGEDALIIPLIDAKKKRFYCSFINSGDEGMYDLSIEEITDRCLATGKQNIIFTGKDVALAEKYLEERIPAFTWLYKNSYTAADMLNYAKASTATSSKNYPEPIYLRQSEAEITLLAKKGKINQ